MQQNFIDTIVNLIIKEIERREAVARQLKTQETIDKYLVRIPVGTLGKARMIQ